MGQQVPRSKKWYLRIGDKAAKGADKWWVKFGLLPLIATAPAGLVSLYLSKVDTRPSLEPLIPSQLLGWMISHPVQAQVAGPLWSWFILLVYAFIISRRDTSQPIDVKKLLYLHEVLETVVASKATRFGKYVKGLLHSNPGSGNNTKSPKTAFSDITQPEQQIALLTQAIHSFFSDNFPDISLRVSVACIKDGSPYEWLYWYPEEAAPRTDIENLRDKNSSMSRCVRKKDIFVVADIQHAARGAMRSYVQAREDTANEEGSLICFPIHHPYSDDIPYVINIAANIKKCFKNADRDLYKWMLQHFTLRIGLEHSLLLIKKECQNEQNKKEYMR